jgi:hypothetical protein
MAEVHNPPHALLNEHDVANILGLSVASVRRWRLLRTGPPFKKVFSSVRYKPEDVRTWIESLPTGGGKPEAR